MRGDNIVTFEQLEFIVAVKQLGTIIAAAKSLNVSHPGISKSISNLETELGVNIFLRSRSGTKVTPEGELIIQLAQEILEKANQIKHLSTDVLINSHLRIEAFPIDSMLFLSKAVSEFKSRYSNIEINISNANITEIITNLREQKIDFGLLALMQFQRPQLERNIIQRTLLTSRMVIACSPQSPIADKPFVTVDELIKYPFVLHNDPLILDNLNVLFSEVGMPKIIMKTNDNTLIKQMIIDGKAMSTYTEILGKSEPLVKQGKLVLVPLKCKDDIHRIDFIYAYNSKKQLSLVDKTFISHLKTAAEFID